MRDMALQGKGLGGYARREKSYYGRDPFRARPLTHGRDPSRTGETPHGRDPSRARPLTGYTPAGPHGQQLPSLPFGDPRRASICESRPPGFELRVRLGDGCEGGAPGELCTLVLGSTMKAHKQERRGHGAGNVTAGNVQEGSKARPRRPWPAPPRFATGGLQASAEQRTDC